MLAGKKEEGVIERKRQFEHLFNIEIIIDKDSIIDNRKSSSIVIILLIFFNFTYVLNMIWINEEKINKINQCYFLKKTRKYIDGQSIIYSKWYLYNFLYIFL